MVQEIIAIVIALVLIVVLPLLIGRFCSSYPSNLLEVWSIGLVTIIGIVILIFLVLMTATVIGELLFGWGQ